MAGRNRSGVRLQVALGAVLVAVAGVSGAQVLGNLVSPGPLSEAHAKLEGIKNCERCHEPGRGVSAQRCLSCHQPIAERVAAKRGVHREVADDCVGCHTEHAGRDAELRPLDPGTFDHATEAGYPLTGLHAPLAADCARCHTTRSFLTATTECASCHKDPHRPSLGQDCATCHSTATAFKSTAAGFDHSKAAFPLTGAHVRVACAKCHEGKGFRGIAFSTCASCHKDPHEKRFGSDCASCHAAEAWTTQRVAHDRTGFPLIGKHATVACASCHKQPAMRARVEHQRCASCHSDPHRGRFKEDCAACHAPTGFRGAAFDHAARTRFTLTGRHAEVTCAACHKKAATAGPGASHAVDFGGLRSECASCHTDAHRGTLGSDCAACHSTATFKISEFRHPGDATFFAGRHEGVACAKCHAPAPLPATATPAEVTASRPFRGVTRECASCHRDVHLGQLGRDCARCHSVATAGFKASSFAHATTAFPLAGRHQTVPCEKCHRSETGNFPAGAGTAVRFAGVSTACASCHQDPHLGQLGGDCARCHSAATFKLPGFTHPNQAAFFTGAHARAECATCHKSTTGTFPGGRGTAVRYAGLDTACASCHGDAHHGEMGRDCASCHQPESWASTNRAFHKSTRFPLTGQHLSVACESCHAGGVFAGTPTECFDCHWIRRQDDRFATRLGNQCEACHSTLAWTAVSWDHATDAGFPLNGAHLSLDCESCHEGGRFEPGLSPDCYGCHRSDYESTADPNHAQVGYPTACQPCHTASDTSWHQGRFAHASFPLLGAHAGQLCETCHAAGVFQGLPADCVACHRAAYDSATSPNHATAGFGTDCLPCHVASDLSWGQGRYGHQAWPLLGAHVGATCATCHGSNVYHGLASACVDCHLTDYQQAADPDHRAAALPTDCTVCHSASDPSWHEARFDHAVYPLLGLHAQQACTACHASGVYSGLPSACVDCHRAVFDATVEPDHRAAGFTTDCASCHGPADPDWTQGRYEHTAFALVGAHAARACTTCHANGVYQGLPGTCVDCHLPDYQRAAQPDHAAAGLPTDCAQCHKASDLSWGDGVFEHAGYALEGVHASQACAACHASGVYSGLPSQCVDCHLGDWQQTAAPSHAPAGFGTDCLTCHLGSDPDWQHGRFGHETWPLLGAHVTPSCTTCHTGTVFAGLPDDCVSCHLADYRQAKDPDHALAGFPTDCRVCHAFTDLSWDQATFDHSSFALLGAHALQACDGCHASGVYQGLPGTCVDCHLSEYQRAAQPDHAAAGLPTDCAQCHKASDLSWGDGVFDHATFPLVGVHLTQPCTACHSSGVYAGLPSECVDCHLDDYQGTTDPNHAVVGFPTTCQDCHNPADASWDQGQFSHSTFPLVGVHLTQPCTACHAGGVYAGLPSECVDCHLDDYQGTTDPNHAAVGFPTSCQDCHNPADASWDQGEFNHAAWPLEGSHALQTCDSCHAGGVYSGLSSDCVSCHLAKYESTTRPDHAAAGFPTDCAACHRASDTAWEQGRFDHVWFPIASGRHSGIDCATCHYQSSNFTVFSCLNGCHPPGETNGHHDEVPGYVYNSENCYDCHRDGRAGD